jgi:two-component system chemotaxis sensor kinase CheA
VESRQRAIIRDLEFLAEADELLERVSLALSRLEKGGDAALIVSELYRDVHTMKGSAQLFGCQRIGSVMHAMETALEPLRAGSARLGKGVADALYAGLDAVRHQVKSLRDCGAEVAFDAAAEAALSRLADVTIQLLGGGVLVVRDEAPPVPQEVLCTQAPRASTDEGVSAMKPSAPKPEPPHREATAEARPAGPETLRVSVELLDKLINLAGELVLIRNQVQQIVTAHGAGGDLTNLSQRLSVVTTELQNEVMKTRMQPIGNVVSKFHRVVRDMARELGKSVDLVLEGVETELDKTLIEGVKDPLTHIVRNAVDHGLETPTERRAAGKPETGVLTLRSYHEGGQVVVEVCDDGRGLSRERIGAKAVDKGLITPEVLAAASDREVQQLIFAAGFSTAEKVSNFSGRGVGMDVVRTNVERLGGVVDLSSVDGKGTTLRLKLPLTLAIIPALIVRAGAERFAIPQVKLVELVQAERDASTGGFRGFEQLQGAPVYRLRGNLLPLVSLADALGLGGRGGDSEGTLNIVVLSADDRSFGLVVEAIDDSTDIVIKPLAGFLKGLDIYSGATVLGDGSIVLTLDVAGLASRSGVLAQSASAEARRQVAAPVERAATDVSDFLTVDVGAPSRHAIPLCLVKRLEEFPADSFEYSGAQRVVCYRDTILPVVSLMKHLAIPETQHAASEAAGSVPVVVVEKRGRSVGLEVRQLLEVLSVDGVIDAQVRDREAILGTMLYRGDVVVVIDVHAIIDQLLGVGRPATAAGVGPEPRRSHHVLLVEDSVFFRRHVARVLEDAGFRVTTANDGREGLDALTRAPQDFSLVVSDIEMPRMNGLDLARQVRQSPTLATLPLIALTSRFRQADQEEGRRAGFTHYLEKLNDDELLHALDAVLGAKAA